MAEALTRLSLRHIDQRKVVSSAFIRDCEIRSALRFILLGAVFSDCALRGLHLVYCSNPPVFQRNGE